MIVNKASHYYALLLALGVFIAPATYSAETPTQTDTDALVNNKPITIDADNQQIDIQNNTITFSGNVVIIQDGLNVNADRVVIEEMQDRSKQRITAFGKPVRFKQIMQDQSKNITGHSNQLIYSVSQNLVTLIGSATLIQQDNQINSEHIEYFVDKQQIQAGSSKGRVTTTIVPNQVREINK